MGEFVIVVPFYNEENRIKKNLNYWLSLGTIKNIEWIFVDDGSQDATSKELQNLAGALKNIHLHNLNKNQGKAKALQIGMALALERKPKFIGFLDGDASISQQDFERIIELSKFKFIKGNLFSAVFASRISLSGREINRKIIRKWNSRIIATVFGFFTDDLPYDTQCGFKLFVNNRSFNQVIKTHKFKTRWFFDLELLIAMRRISEVRVYEEPLDSWKDEDDSKLNTLKNYLLVSLEILYIILLLSSYRLIRINNKLGNK